MKQINLGKGFGVYFTELQNSMGLVGLGSSLMNLTVLWAVAGEQIRALIPWLNYPLFTGLVFLVVLVILPVIHWFFLYAAPQQVQSEQSYKHNNPFKSDIEQLKADIALIKKHMGIEE